MIRRGGKSKSGATGRQSRSDHGRELPQEPNNVHVERVLHTMGFHAALCHGSAQWAYQRHLEAYDHATALAAS